ncbi:50S ribosomal protein L3 [Desulfopila aestuarii]|uniref:Large ribosomal subunit protein uL3 n=1 Tax=Desulfopila aestuarii DSM 18488 TaxID=1121416 RepID=A0A1M7Y0C7_9BACT|nr:50S ribosomal protein L3 [Desulfopila aestuarii]SHO44980.1 LSU ribosomal protein L3P [Desulfopila aestuarii DSM 18488]
MPKTMGILGKKIGMTRVYSELGQAIPVTVVEAGPCKILQVKTVATDGYNAIQVGFANKKAQRVNKPDAGHFKKSDSEGFYHIREFRVADAAQYTVGQEISVSELFKVGDVVHVQGTSKGKGFQGVMKRHGFGGGRDTHGSMFHRAPGSIGTSAWPSRVVKGKKMPGQMGNQTVLKKNAIVIDIRADENIVLLKGPVPGAQNGLLKIFAK